MQTCAEQAYSMVQEGPICDGSDERCHGRRNDLREIGDARQSWIARNLDSYGLYGFYTEREHDEFINDCHEANPIPPEN